MYIPRHFEQDDIATLHALMRNHPLCTLVTLSADGLNANHIPLHLSSEPGSYGILRGHVARVNPVWSNVKADTEVLAVFQGPQAYITPSWYPTKAESGKAVPTWNYTAVHAYGTLRCVEDQEWLRNHLDALTNAQEAVFSAPWKVSDAPDDYISKMLNAIVGIEITITRLQGKWKTSQNQPEGNRAGVERGLRMVGTTEAGLMADLVQGRNG